MKFKSYSQVGQDQWVYDRLGDRGVFLDIGSGHPVERSNTYGLELVGWVGALVDNDLVVEQLSQMRRAPFVRMDATQPWVSDALPKTLDYLSLDVDSATAAALARFVSQRRFRMATIEHDSYRFGGAARDQMRKLLIDQGYKLEVADVSDQGLAFEDWWVDPKTV